MLLTNLPPAIILDGQEKEWRYLAKHMVNSKWKYFEKCSKISSKKLYLTIQECQQKNLKGKSNAPSLHLLRVGAWKMKQL